MRGRSVPALLACLLFWGCSEVPVPAEGDALTPCGEPRPEICTREYRPVCARRRDGSEHTYATSCTACADENVVGHRAGACPGEDGG